MAARRLAILLALLVPVTAAGTEPTSPRRARADDRPTSGAATRAISAGVAGGAADEGHDDAAPHDGVGDGDGDADGVGDGAARTSPGPAGTDVRAPDPLAGVEIRRRPDAVADVAVVVSIDGLRADAVTPALRTLASLQRTGAVATRMQTIERSTTLASHAAMVSGVDADVHGLTWNAWRPARGRIRFPTLFRLARLAGLDGAMFVAKAKLRHVVDPVDGAATFRVAGGGCERVVEAATPWLREARTGVALVHFPDPDSAGHRHGWMTPAYRRAVAQADACLGRVVSALRARRGGTERVLLVVTSDHGGHGRSHGTRLDVDRDIPWIAWGGAARRGTRIARPALTTDTAATVLEALGLPATPGMSGRPVAEALRPVTSTRPAAPARSAAASRDATQSVPVALPMPATPSRPTVRAAAALATVRGPRGAH
jgi:hypothetical protein